jgi:hypothetical protein
VVLVVLLVALVPVVRVHQVQVTGLRKLNSRETEVIGNFDPDESM